MNVEDFAELAKAVWRVSVSCVLVGIVFMLTDLSSDEPATEIGEAWSSAPVVPACQEDEVVVGRGDFKGGYWSAYGCETLDDVCLGTWAAPEVCDPAFGAGYHAGYAQVEAEGVSP